MLILFPAGQMTLRTVVLSTVCPLHRLEGCCLKLSNQLRLEPILRISGAKPSLPLVSQYVARRLVVVMWCYLLPAERQMWRAALAVSTEHVWACGNSSLPIPSLSAFSFVLLSRRFQTPTFPSLLDQHSTLSPTLYSTICLFIEDNCRLLLVDGIVGTRARATEWTGAATTRRKHELVSVCLSIQNVRVQVYCSDGGRVWGEGAGDVLMWFYFQCLKSTP
jgi:hypothetical protein